VSLLLQLEKQQSAGVSKAIWIPTIWMLHAGSKPLGRWIGSAQATAETSPLDRAFLILLFCLALWVLSLRKFDWPRAINDNRWLIALIVYMLISVLWSSMPGVSFKRVIRETTTIFMAFVVLSDPYPRRAMESIIRRTTYIFIPFSLLLIKYFPYYGVDYTRWSGTRMWIGVTTQKNGLGRLCIISVFFLIWSIARRQKSVASKEKIYQTLAEIFILLLAIYLMRGPGGDFFYSATSMYALIAGLLSYSGLLLAKKYRINFKSLPVTLTVAFIIIIGHITLFRGGTNISSLASTAGRDATLTGRTEVWAELLPVAMEKPVLGHGYGGFWTPLLREAFRIREAHSGYLEILIQLGFAGTMFISLFLLSFSRKALPELEVDFDWAAIWICFLIMAVVHNITESSIISLSSHLTAIVVFFSVISSRAHSQKQES
jgi:exopolysaccharide production protein ExoQ